MDRNRNLRGIGLKIILKAIIPRLVIDVIRSSYSRIPASVCRFFRMIKAPYILDEKYKERIGRYVALDGKMEKGDYDFHASLLRLYAHCLDKGMHRADFEKGHSRYEYAKVLELRKRTVVDDGTDGWIKAIIDDYHEAQRSGVISENYRKRYNINERPVEPSAFMRLSRKRRSCRQFLGAGISAEVIQEIVTAALEAPSSCNRQTVRYYYTQNRSVEEEALKCFSGYTGFTKGGAMLLLFCVDLRPYNLPNEIFLPTLDAGLAAAHFSLAATTHGLNVTFLSMGPRSRIQDEDLRKLYKLPEFVDVVVGGIVGYPEFEAQRPERIYLNKSLIKVV